MTRIDLRSFTKQQLKFAVFLMGAGLLTSSCRPLLGGSGMLSMRDNFAIPESYQNSYWALELPKGTGEVMPSSPSSANCLYLLHFSVSSQTNLVSCPGQIGYTRHQVVASDAQVKAVTALDHATGQTKSFDVQEASILTPAGSIEACPDADDAPSQATSVARLGSDSHRLLVWTRKPSAALVYVRISAETFQKVFEQATCQP